MDACDGVEAFTFSEMARFGTIFTAKEPEAKIADARNIYTQIY